MKQLVSVVIVGFNHEFYLRACLTSLQQQDHSAIEIIYVDNASADDSVALVAKFDCVKIIRNDANFGFAKGNNIGIEQAQGEFVFVLNPDTTLAPDCISRLVAYMHDVQDVGICMPKLLHQERPDTINSVGMTYDRRGHQYHIGDGEVDAGQYANPMEILLVAGACMFCRKETLEQIGGFDESYFAYYEDTELSLRTWWHGWRCVYVPNAVVYHMRNAAAKSSDDYYQKARYFVHRNQYWPLLTFMPLSFILRILPSLIRSDLRVVGRGILRLIRDRRIPVELHAKRDAIARMPWLLTRRNSLRTSGATDHHKFLDFIK